MGATWTLVHSATGAYNCVRLMLCADGEILYITPATVSKSSGWASNPSTATFAAKFSANATAGILPFTIDGNGTKFVIAEYAGTWEDSRYATISVDGGDTWTRKWDSGVDSTTHLHGACYDPWTDRFYLIEGHSAPKGIYYSDDDGDNWAKITGTDSYFSGGGPTVCVATKYGLVLGTDGPINGIHHMRNVASGLAADMRPELAWEWRSTAQVTGVIGFAEMGWYDSDSGLVYLCYSTSLTLKAVIAASDGKSAGLLYTVPESGIAEDSVEQIYAADGKVWAQVAITAGTVLNHLTAEHDGYAVVDQSVLDSGAVLGGEVASQHVGASMAIGPTAKASGANSLSAGPGVKCASDVVGVVLVGSGLNVTSAGAYSTLLGYEFSGSIGSQAVGIGYSLDMSGGSLITVVGADASGLGGSCVAGGYKAKAYAFDTIVGVEAEGSSGTSQACFGWKAKSPAAYGAMFGFNAHGTGAGTWQSAFGTSATTGAADASAFGGGAICAYVGSVSLGRATAATATQQVAMGPRHIEISEQTAPGVPAANSLRLYASDDGNGVTQLSVHTSAGITQLSPHKLRSYTVGTVPAVTIGDGGMIYVTDEAGGEVPAFCDGTNWRRVTDRAIVST